MHSRCHWCRAQAFHLGLLDTAGLHHVCVAAVKDQRYATCRYSMDRHIRWPQVVDQLADDVAVANQLLPPDKQVWAVLRTTRNRLRPVFHCQYVVSGTSAAIATEIVVVDSLQPSANQSTIVEACLTCLAAFLAPVVGSQVPENARRCR